MTGLLKLAAAGFAACLGMGALAGGALAAPNHQATTASTACAFSGNQLVQSVSYTDNEGTFTTLAGNVQPGDHVVVNFTVPANCSVVLSFVSYQAPGATYDPNAASQQTVFSSQDSVTFAAGAHSMAIDIPPCFFQVDFVRGAVIQHLGPGGSSNFYGAQGRLISAGNGGTTACAGGGTQGITTPGTTNGSQSPAGGIQGITTPATGAGLAIGTPAVLVVVGLLLVVGAGVRRRVL
jgi:hypothetical protein